MQKSKTDLTYQQDTQTLIGETRRQLMDLDTKEIIEVDQIVKRIYGQKAFWKIYLRDFMNVLGILDSKQLDILVYIVENTNSATNMFLGTYKSIAKEVKCSEPTIAKVMKKLKDKNFIRTIQNGVYLVNPQILMKGDPNKQQILLSYYNTADASVKTNSTGKKPVSKLAESTGNLKPVTADEDGQIELQEIYEDVEE